MREAFDLFDNDKDGHVDYHELKVGRGRGRGGAWSDLRGGCAGGNARAGL